MQKGRTMLLAVRLFLLVIASCTVVTRIGFFGAVPDVILPCLVVLSLTLGGAASWKTVSVAGLCMGFLVDAIGGVGFGLLSPFYFLVGAFCPNLMRRNGGGILEQLVLFYLYLVPIAVLREGVTLVTLLLQRPNGFSLGVCFTNALLPEFFGTLLFALPVFSLFRERNT